MYTLLEYSYGQNAVERVRVTVEVGTPQIVRRIAGRKREHVDRSSTGILRYPAARE